MIEHFTGLQAEDALENVRLGRLLFLCDVLHYLLVQFAGVATLGCESAVKHVVRVQCFLFRLQRYKSRAVYFHWLGLGFDALSAGGPLAQLAAFRWHGDYSRQIILRAFILVYFQRCHHVLRLWQIAHPCVIVRRLVTP